MVTQVVVVAMGVTDMPEILQLDVRDAYWAFSSVCPFPIGIWSLVLRMEAAQVLQAILDGTFDARHGPELSVKRSFKPTSQTVP
jgi:hypothetical protein